MQEIHGAFGVPLADAPADDRLLSTGHGDENILVALGCDLVAKHVLLLLAHKTPCLIQLAPVSANADHDAVMQFHAAHTDAKRQVANGATVHAGKARGGADADAFAKRGNNFNLLFAGEYVHGSSSFCVKGWPLRNSSKSALPGLYSPDGRSLRAHPRGCMIRAGAVAAASVPLALVWCDGGEIRTHETLAPGKVWGSSGV